LPPLAQLTRLTGRAISLAIAILTWRWVAGYAETEKMDTALGCMRSSLAVGAQSSARVPVHWRKLRPAMAHSAKAPFALPAPGG